MTVRKGQPWGTSAVMPPGTEVFSTDSAAARAFQHASNGNSPIEVGLTGGDLWRTLGAPPGGEERLRGGECTRATVDVGWVDLGRYGGHCFIAHCVARTRLWTNFTALMNAEWLGDWDVAPRSHPGDGRLDVLEGELRPQELFPVRARLPTGTHLPHPSIRTTRTQEATFEFARPRRVWLDGSLFPRISSLSVWVQAGSLTVYV